jgi:hypothetical protein
MPQAVTEASRLPLGSHSLSLHADSEEAAEQAASFLAGTPEGQPASYWVGDETLLPHYHEILEVRAPGQVEAVHPLEGPQVQPEGPVLRPIPEVTQFVGSHPEGVTGGGDTISQYWTPQTIPAYLEYEAWFDAQPREHSRFICPYNLRRVPPGEAPKILRELGAHHSHVVLSQSSEMGVRLLQLFVFGAGSEVPPAIRPDLDWAVESGLVARAVDSGELTLTASGDAVIAAWSRESEPDAFS